MEILGQNLKNEWLWWQVLQEAIAEKEKANGVAVLVH